MAFALLACAALSISPARAGDVVAHPEWASTRVRAARPTAAENALVFDLRTETRAVDGPVRVETATVTLTPSFTYVVAERSRTLDDYALCRTFTWSDGAPGFQNASCYAQPAFATFELASRTRLRAALSHAGLAAAADRAPYWDEAELGVRSAAPSPLVPTRTDGGREYRLVGRAVVRVSSVADRLDADEGRRMSRFLARHVQLHPQVRRDLADEGVLPARLEIETRLLSKPGREVVTVSNLRRAQLAYPLPTGLAAELTAKGEDGSALGQALGRVVAAIGGRPATPKPSLDALVAALHEAAARRHPVEVALGFL